MKKNNFLYSFLSIVIAVVVGVLAAYITMKIKDQTSYAVDISALIVSYIALVISIVTYFSIDKVNNITSMSGNVLENPNYSVTTAELVGEFMNCKNDRDFSKKLLEIVSHPEKGNPVGKTNSIIELTDLIQNFIDHIIWFAYIDYTDKTKAMRENIVNNLQKELEKYDNLSNGIQYLIDENCKLISYVLMYQDSTRNDTYENNMENIRGSMLINPVSQIVYYDYFGLTRRKQATGLIETAFEKDSIANRFSVSYMKAIMYHEYDQEQKEKIMFFLNQAMHWFNRAAKLADNDILWKGYILYNKVRTRIQRMLIEKDMSDEKIASVENDIEDTLAARKAVCILYGNEDNYLSKQFHLEYKHTEILLEEFRKMRLEDVGTVFN